jgi:hypothetical protein
MSCQLFPFLCGHRTDEDDVRVGLFRLLSRRVPKRSVFSAQKHSVRLSVVSGRLHGWIAKLASIVFCNVLILAGRFRFVTEKTRTANEGSGTRDDRFCG